MLTIQALRDFGANTAVGVERCMGREDFYLRMVKLSLADHNFAKLRDAISAGDLSAGFEAAHAIKGVMANLSLDPILKPVSEACELLRARTGTDYSGYLAEIEARLEQLRALAAE